MTRLFPGSPTTHAVHNGVVESLFQTTIWSSSATLNEVTPATSPVVLAPTEEGEAAGQRIFGAAPPDSAYRRS